MRHLARRQEWLAYRRFRKCRTGLPNWASHDRGGRIDDAGGLHVPSPHRPSPTSTLRAVVSALSAPNGAAPPGSIPATPNLVDIVTLPRSGRANYAFGRAGGDRQYGTRPAMRNRLSALSKRLSEAIGG